MFIQSRKCEKFFITSQANDPSCTGKYVGDPCLTLRELILDVHQLYTMNTNRDPNTTILEMQSGVHLPFSSFILENIDTLVIRGTNATIDCQFGQVLRIRNIRLVNISGLQFTPCQQHVFIDNVNELVIYNSTFQRQLQLSGIDIVKIKKTSFINGAQALFARQCTSITIEQCTFDNNRMNVRVDSSNLTIKDSLFSRNRNDRALYVSNSHDNAILAISDTIFRDNRRGAVRVSTRGNITVMSSAFINNSAPNFGAAIYWSTNSDGAKASIFDSRFTDNYAGDYGGAIYASSSVHVSRCSFINNTAKNSGGAIRANFRSNQTFLVEESAFTFNSAAYCGVFQIEGISHSIKLSQSSFMQNQARGGRASPQFFSDPRKVRMGNNNAGVMCTRKASISLLESYFSNNSAVGNGGVVYVDDSTVNIRGCAFDNNSAGMNGGVTYTEFYHVHFEISNSLFTNNQAGGKGRVLHIGRSGSYVEVERSAFGNNTARDKGGVFVILGGLLDSKETNFYGNKAKSGGDITACDSEISISDDLVATVDDKHPVCTHYDGRIDGFNISAPPDDLTTTTAAPTDVTTSTISIATTISTPLTTISDTGGSSATTLSPIPTLPDTTTSPLSVYFVLRGSVYLNNSAIALEEIGEGEDALICRTNNRDCCATPPNRAGEFYYPKGDTIPIRSRAEDFYRNRGDGEIRLNRIIGSITVSGRFGCAIPDASGTVQVVYIYLL